LKALNYRMNRLTYSVLLATLVAVYAIMLNIMERPAGAVEVIAAFLVVPRLHDIGRSGWWFLVLVAGEFIAIAIGWQGGTEGILLAGGIYVLVALVVLTLLAFIPGEPCENRWGLPPEFGFHMRRETAEAEVDWRR
jgi:uncharacterized membrane protein YhaH (DUF805 family)